MNAHGTVGRYDKHGCRCQPCCNAKATYQRMVRAGLTKRRTSQDVVDDALFMWGTGEGRKAIAERLDMKQDSVDQAFRRAGVAPPWRDAA